MPERPESPPKHLRDAAIFAVVGCLAIGLESNLLEHGAEVPDVLGLGVLIVACVAGVVHELNQYRQTRRS